MILTKIIGKLRCPILICDGCGAKIEKSSDGLVIERQNGAVEFRHKSHINPACDLPGEPWVGIGDFFHEVIRDLNLDGENEEKSAAGKNVAHLVPGTELESVRIQMMRDMRPALEPEEMEQGEKSAIDEGVAHLLSAAGSDSDRIMRLWGIVQLDYPADKGGMGNVAADQLREMIGAEAFIALFQITGFCMAKPSRVDILRLLKE